MKKKQTPNSFPYFFGSVALVVTAIMATAILNRTTNTATVQDARTRASVTSLMRMRAVVTSLGDDQGTIVVNSLQFAGSAPQNLEGLARNTAGEWTVSVGSGVNLNALSPGARIELQVNPTSFDIKKRSLSAAGITVLR